MRTTAPRLQRASDVSGVAPNVVQRIGDLSKVPAGLGCRVPVTQPQAPVTNRFLFAAGSFTLIPAQIAEIGNFVNAWHAAGARDQVRVDGYASTEGSDESNWRLSCERAEAVLAELTSPSSLGRGIPAGFIQEFAQGETTQFGATREPNRRVQITSTLTLPPTPAAAPACPQGAASTQKTAIIQPVRIARDDGSNPTSLPPLARLDIWRRCCIDPHVASPVTIDNSDLQVLDHPETMPRFEVQDLIAAAPAGNQINVVIVDDFQTATGLDPDAGGGAFTVTGSTPAVIAVDGVVGEVIAHEAGHAMGFAGHMPPACPGTIMCATGSRTVPPPQSVNAGVCAAVRSSPFLRDTATTCCMNPT